MVRDAFPIAHKRENEKLAYWIEMYSDTDTSRWFISWVAAHGFSCGCSSLASEEKTIWAWNNVIKVQPSSASTTCSTTCSTDSGTFPLKICFMKQCKLLIFNLSYIGIFCLSSAEVKTGCFTFSFQTVLICCDILLKPGFWNVGNTRIMSAEYQCNAFEINLKNHNLKKKRIFFTQICPCPYPLRWLSPPSPPPCPPSPPGPPCPPSCPPSSPPSCPSSLT